MNKNTKAIMSLSLPALILILAYAGLTKMDSLSPSVIKNIPYLPYVFLLITVVLAYRFNQSKVFYLALAFIFIQSIMPGTLYEWTSFDQVQLDLVYSLIGVLVPLNIVIFSLVKERGIFSLWGFLKLLFIGGQFAGAAWVISSLFLPVLNIVNGGFLPWNLDFLPGIEPLSLLVIVISVMVALLQWRLTKSYFSAISMGMILSTALLVYSRDMPLAAPLFISSIGLMMIIYIIQNSYSMVYLDELTEIPGRRALREEMMKLSGNYVVAMVDIDFFKKFNDKYGHDVGDDVLRMVAAKLDHVTGGGKAFRYGGEEFTIIFSGKQLADVWPHLEKLRENIARSDFAIRGQNRPKKKPENIKPAKNVKKVSITVSIGAAEKSHVREKADDVLKAADKALYRAKENGRNRVSK